MLRLQVEIFALPTNVTIAIGPPHAQRIVMLRMAPGRVNLRKLAYLNDLFDALREERIDLRESIAKLAQIDERCPPAPAARSVVALTCVAVGVAVLLGGGLSEIALAALIGASTGIINFFTQRHPIVLRLFEAIAAFTGTLIVAAFTTWIAPANLYISIVAGVVVLLPGYSLTLALNELANQDLIAGTARLGRVFAVLLSLGCGAFLAFAAVGTHFMHRAAVAPHPVGPIYWVAAAILLSVGLSMDLDARLRDFSWVFLSSVVALAASYFFGRWHTHAVAPFLAALACGLAANGGARYLRVPQPVLLVPALNVLVPGSLSYESVLWVISAHNYTDAAALATAAIIAAILIVAGLLLSQLLVPEAPLRVRASR